MRSYCKNDSVNHVDLWGLNASDAGMAGVPPQHRTILQQQKEDSKSEYINPTTGKITSEFGPRESFVTDNGIKTNPFHGGIDEANVEGTPIVSATDGIVIDTPKTPTESPYGNYVIIGNKSQGWSNYTLYGHLSEPTPLKVGDTVKQGEEIGKKDFIYLYVFYMFIKCLLY